MTESEQCRRYLERALYDARVAWQHASEALGYNASYIHQYIQRGVPKFLRESDRELLAQLYGIDPDRLKPPAKAPAPLAPRTKRASPYRNTEVAPEPENKTLDPDLVMKHLSEINKRHDILSAQLDQLVAGLRESGALPKKVA